MSEINQLGEQNKSRNFNEVIENYELLIRSIHAELALYKKEQSTLKENVLKIVQENQVVQSEIRDLKNTKVDNENKELEKLTNYAIINLKTQINHLIQERETLRSLWETSEETVNNLETEISNYRHQILKPNTVSEIRKKYDNTIQLLENTIKTTRQELGRQGDINKEILREKKFAEDRIKTLQEKILEQENKIFESKKSENSLDNIKNKFDIVMKTNNELQKSLNQAQAIINERFHREKEALQKVQEALHIAENALSEKEAALSREKTIREECEHLAATIGQVIEEAANRVEKNVENLKAQHKEEIRNLTESSNEMKALLESHKNKAQQSEMRIQKLEKELRDVMQDNIALDSDLQVASQAIIEMELKMEAIEHLLGNDKKSNNICLEKEIELQNFLLNNKQLKQRWKNEIEEVTGKLKHEITNLQKDNTALKIENEDLRQKLVQQ